MSLGVLSGSISVSTRACHGIAWPRESGVRLPAREFIAPENEHKHIIDPLKLTNIAFPYYRLEILGSI